MRGTQSLRHAYVRIPLLFLLVIAPIALSSFGQVTAQDPSATTCSTAQLQAGSQAATSSINETQAKSVAAPTLASDASDYNASFNSVFYRLGWTSTCSVYLENVNVAYDLKQGNVTKYTIEISLNPALSSVLGVTEYPAQFRTGTVVDSFVWVGPEYYDSSGLGMSSAGWEIPSASQGYSGQGCSSNCTFSFWVGQSHNEGGGTYPGVLAQAGTDSNVLCNPNCSSTQDIWYEFLPAGVVECGFVGTDSVTSTVTHVLSGSNYVYSAETYDDSTSQACVSSTSSGSNYMGEAYYAQFMGEAVNDGLPKFTALDVSSGFYYDTGNNNIHWIDNSWAYGYVLDQATSSQSCDGNSVYYNVCPSGVSSGSFSETWLTSSGYS